MDLAKDSTELINFLPTCLVMAHAISNNSVIHVFMKDNKGKAIPLEAWAGLECSRRLRLPDFKTIGT
jgi:hypothetical protein